MTCTVGLLGDVMLGRGVAERLLTSPAEDVWSSELREVLSACDFVICNLECCISGRGRPTELVRDKPFFFRAPPVGVESLRAIRVDLAGLANNHALDYGEEALADTLEHLSASGIATAGAGRSPDDAHGGVAVEHAQARVGVVAVSDHPREFAVGDGRWGISHADLGAALPHWLVAELQSVRQQVDWLIAFPHWGPNMTVRPARWQRERAAELAAAGADLVVGHSAHVFHGCERLEGALVAYDLGDALDDYAVDPRLRNDLGLLALWHPTAEEDGVLELVGLGLDYCHTGLAKGSDADWVAARLEKACGELDARIERIGEQRFRLGA
jgi:poly-gamma-glutamate capsule biosynthesis protein CapA/YwtB (metallophosphatase superfamily)